MAVCHDSYRTLPRHSIDQSTSDRIRVQKETPLSSDVDETVGMAPVFFRGDCLPLPSTHPPTSKPCNNIGPVLFVERPAYDALLEQFGIYMVDAPDKMPDPLHKVAVSMWVGFLEYIVEV